LSHSILNQAKQTSAIGDQRTSATEVIRYKASRITGAFTSQLSGSAAKVKVAAGFEDAAARSTWNEILARRLSPCLFELSGLTMKQALWDRFSFMFCAGLLVAIFASDSRTQASAQAADAEQRCTGDVMRLCSEFTPNVDSIMICLKAKRLQLSSSCLNALLPQRPQPVSTRPSSTKIAQKSRRTVSPAEASRSTRVHQVATR
jgi:hypothetical protein